MLSGNNRIKVCYHKVNYAPILANDSHSALSYLTETPKINVSKETFFDIKSRRAKLIELSTQTKYKYLVLILRSQNNKFIFSIVGRYVKSARPTEYIIRSAQKHLIINDNIVTKYGDRFQLSSPSKINEKNFSFVDLYGWVRADAIPVSNGYVALINEKNEVIRCCRTCCNNTYAYSGRNAGKFDFQSVPTKDPLYLIAFHSKYKSIFSLEKIKLGKKKTHRRDLSLKTIPQGVGASDPNLGHTSPLALLDIAGSIISKTTGRQNQKEQDIIVASIMNKCNIKNDKIIENEVSNKIKNDIDRAIQAYKNKKYADAERLLTSIIKTGEPDTMEKALWYRGMACHHLNRYKCAISTAKTLKKNFPNSDKGFVLSGIVGPGGTNDLFKAVRKFPNSYLANYYLGLKLFGQRGSEDYITTALAICLRRNAMNDSICQECVIRSGEENWNWGRYSTETAQGLDAILKIDPNNAKAHYLRAYQYLFNQKCNKAYYAIKIAAQLAPRYAGDIASIRERCK